jgi:(1->4)-alpha-D-glucan 1-alpha-D-glucosylmutase
MSPAAVGGTGEPRDAHENDRPGRELRATYRLQLTPEFGFDAARELVPYLRDLGNSHLYLSPSLQARKGSTHGYDVVDPGRISEDLGGERAFRALAQAANGAGMGLVLDVVPNHMATDEANRFWADPGLRERFFDVDPVTGRHRRFFDVDELAGVRVERDEVFQATHGLVLALVREGLVDGLRIDHPDGLADPAGYLRRLRAGGARRIWVEKILASTERLPGEWPVSGTVGYEFLNDACGLFIDRAAEPILTVLWEELSGDRRPFGAYALEAKLEQAMTTFTPEVERLARAGSGSAGAEAVGGHAPSVEALTWALAELPVYRTYEPPSAGAFITRFQQTSPAIMAKGVEDTAFYRFGRLLALNDVGGAPGRFGLSVEDFHAAAAERAAAHPEALLSTMTHDAKRSTDTRARMVALTQVPEEWAVLARRLLDASASHCTVVDGREAPDLSERYFILQTLVGVWPIEPERLDTYLEKALREAKRNTSWVEQNDEWEDAVKRYARALIEDQAFLASFEPFMVGIAARGAMIVLGWLALKLTAPGIPDTYQGDELELRALVDPDNRRPVDWALRRELLSRLQGGGRPAGSLDEQKLWLMARLLGLRARRPELFLGASYEPLDAGPAACAYLRGGGLLTVVRLPRAGVPAASSSVVRGLPGGRWREVLTGEERSLDGDLLVADLVAHDTGIGVYERV